MKKVKIIILIALVLMLLQSFPVKAASGTELMDCFSVRVTLVENEVEHEWEYDNPNRYEYEKGNVVIKGKEAKSEVTHLLQQLQLSEEKRKEDYAATLKSMFPHLERFEIHWMTRNSERFTWQMDLS